MVNVNHLLTKATIDQRRARDRALRQLQLFTVDHRLTDWSAEIATSLLARHSALAAQKRVIYIYKQPYWLAKKGAGLTTHAPFP